MYWSFLHNAQSLFLPTTMKQQTVEYEPSFYIAFKSGMCEREHCRTALLISANTKCYFTLAPQRNFRLRQNSSLIFGLMTKNGVKRITKSSYDAPSFIQKPKHRK